MTTQGASSIASALAGLPREQWLKAIGKLTEQEALDLLYDWSFWARPEQLPPACAQGGGDWFTWLLDAGRGFGKTRTGAEYVIARAKSGYKRIALVGQTKADVRDTMIEVGDSSILAISPPWFYPIYEASKRRLLWPNGAMGIIYSGDEPDQLRGPQHDTAWVDELAKFKYPKESWDNLELGLRLGADPRVCVTTTPRPIPIIKQLLADPMTAIVRGYTEDNLQNLSPSFIRRVVMRYQGTRLGRQELYGEILEDTPGALWKRTRLDDLRVKEAPPMVRVVVSIDPAVTAGEDSDETGIIVAGRGRDGHGYTLEDVTLRGSPSEWATRAAVAYYRWHADRVIGEVNNGGDMIGYTLRTIDPNIPFKAVHATRGKMLRAEPVSALYEQGKWHHVGAFAQLEDQMCDWQPGDASPDRLDALVWAATELMGLEARPEKVQVLVHDTLQDNSLESLGGWDR